ncbi:hypothetical protein CORC01_07398 [Colletotrichum orchidophilum]|uniref:Uncharacterized protein n=1 Tax=Colletotrichum orchidophilum TaxID=1209926 RepID=A0A1G4B7R4_9PEZI|nr:uncharacterized protein CORC01_07398 [Colletotrichum orchidophilum]OHE97343.1 hypothetical protein CORC01_07398 [Colletotrichum orchidophilum]
MSVQSFYYGQILFTDWLIYSASSATVKTVSHRPQNTQNSEASGLQGQRLDKFLAEPLEDGNRLVLLPDQPREVNTAVKAHRKRASGMLRESKTK